MSGDPGSLVPLYTDDDRSNVRCIGGPRDGDTFTFPNHRPPPMVHLLADVGPPTLADLTRPLEPLRKCQYEPIIDSLGFYSRDEDGTYRYRCTGA